MLSTVMCASSCPLSCRVASIAFLSSGFSTSGTSALVRVLVMGSIRILSTSLGSGTALTHTTMLSMLTFHASRFTHESTQRAMMTFIMSEVPAEGPRTAASRQ